MLVKAQTFTKGGRYPTAQSRAAYLEKDGRAIERETINIVDDKNPYREIDRTAAQHKLRGNVVGREYVLSPSPEDRVSPKEMARFAKDWAVRALPNQECVIVVHNDSKGRISRGEKGLVHAHVYVGSVDLETGRKLRITNADARRIHDLAQDMAKSRGWSEQPRYYDLESQRVQRVQQQRPVEVARSRQREWERLPERTSAAYEKSGLSQKGISLFEYEQAKKGKELVKTFLRRTVREAVAACREHGGKLLDRLASKGVRMERTADGKDFKYSKSSGGRAFKGATLAEDLSRESITRELSAARRGIELSRDSPELEIGH